jgi:hypothetical protein
MMNEDGLFRRKLSLARPVKGDGGVIYRSSDSI